MNSTSNGCVIYNVANLDGFTSSTNNCTNSTENNLNASVIPLIIQLTTVYVTPFVIGIIGIIILCCVCCASCYGAFKVFNQNKKIDEEVNFNIEKLNEKIKILAARR